MFPAETRGEWEPIKVREKRPAKAATTNGANGHSSVDIAMGNVEPTVNGEDHAAEDEEEILFEEDPLSEDGAVWPLKEGHISNWSCFFALLTHLYNTLSPPFHTPILVISQPCWTAQDHEMLTQFFFEKFKTPAFCLMDSALAVCYAYATNYATVVDVGYGKCDVSAISDFVLNEHSRGAALSECGGEAMTQHLMSVLETKGFTREMCEQLKKNPICEILPPGTELPADLGPEEPVANPAAATSTGATGSGDGHRESIAAQGGAPRGPGIDTDAGDADQDRDVHEGEDDDGVLDVATIVASGKTSEFIARKEREKAEKAAAKKTAADAAAASRQAKLPNSKRAKATFHYHERRPLEELNGNNKRTGDGDVNSDGPKQQMAEQPAEASAEAAEDAAAARREERREERRRNREGTAFIKKEVEVGLERFQAASDGLLHRIADSIHRCILSAPEASRRDLWESLIIVGNGSKVKGEHFWLNQAVPYLLTDRPGFKESLFATLNARYLISPSSATIFTSELPSNFTTPVATGANTPQPQLHHASSHHGPSVNPLLHAATTASLAPPGQGQHQLQSQLQMQQYNQQQQHQLSHQHASHAQTPTSIKLLKMPEYFPEWKDFGVEESSFLGAQVAAKVVFVVDQGVSKGFMSRTEYNELGPPGIHESCM